MIPQPTDAHRRIAPRQTRLATCFTLIELLVVVAIISVLAAMLLPSLRKAQTMARRAACLSDRKQNYLQVAMLANDHDDRTVRRIDYYRDGVREMDAYEVHGNQGGHPGDYGASALSTRGGLTAANDTQIYLYTIGAMAALGYVNDPRLLYCSEYSRPMNSTHTSWWDKWHADNNAANKTNDWKDLIDGDDSLPILFSGIASYMYIADSTETYRNRPNIRLADIATLWPTRNASPIVLSCSILKDNTSEWGIAHDYKGVNAAYFDGSGRWIAYEEVLPFLSSSSKHWQTDATNVLRNSGSPGNNSKTPMQYWARESATF